jgi:hypothetical protein
VTATGAGRSPAEALEQINRASGFTPFNSGGLLEQLPLLFGRALEGLGLVIGMTLTVVRLGAADAGFYEALP